MLLQRSGTYTARAAETDAHFDARTDAGADADGGAGADDTSGVCCMLLLA